MNHELAMQTLTQMEVSAYPNMKKESMTKTHRRYIDAATPRQEKIERAVNVEDLGKFGFDLGSIEAIIQKG